MESESMNLILTSSGNGRLKKKLTAEYYIALELLSGEPGIQILVCLQIRT